MTTKKISEEDFSYVTDYSRFGDINDFLEEELGTKFRNYRDVWNKVHTQELETDFPLFISLETQLKCNYKCTMCSFGHPGEIDKMFYDDYMSDELYMKIMKESAENYCPSLGMNVLNEPLLDKKIGQRIALARDHGFIDIRMNSNTSLLTRKRSEELIDSGLTRLYVGLDAATEETYNKVRIGGKFDKVLKNIDTFLQVRKEKKSLFPILRVSFVRTALNEHEIPQFIDYWKDRADMVSIQEYLSPVLGTQEEQLKAKSKLVAESYSCPQPNERMIIKGNGIVNPCCAQFNYKLPMGDINNASLKDVWNNDEMKLLRKLMRENRWQENPVCKKCIGSNYTAE